MNTLTIYQAKDGWRWHMHAPNGRLTAESGEAYHSRSNAKRAAERHIEVVRNGRVSVVVQEP